MPRTTIQFLLLFPVLWFAASASAGKQNAPEKLIDPWAEIAVGAAAKANPDEYNILVIAIDGEMNFEGRRAYRITPGLHYLELASAKMGRRGDITRLPFAIEAKPCVRYELVATHEKRLSNRHWRVTVKAEKPITLCEEALAAAAAMPAPASPTQPAPQPVLEPTPVPAAATPKP